MPDQYDETLRDMLRLIMVPGIGPVRINRLLQAFGNPSAVLRADSKTLTKSGCLEEKTLSALLSGAWDNREVERQIGIMAANGTRPLYKWQEHYPPYLAQIYDAPPVLFVRGRMEYLAAPCVAVVGTRGPSLYGEEMARILAGSLAAAGFTVVSGLARGIDTLAHKSALKAGGTTVAVLGCGLDIIYPAENEKLFGEILERGCVVSEYLMGTVPEGANFPRRNRIISGLSRGVVIVEAGEKSGALITAAYALDQNREVFAVPGDVARGLSLGANRLIQQGAKLVQSVGDILEELGELRPSVDGRSDQKPEPVLTRQERLVFDRLSRQPVHVDELAQALDMDVSRLLGILLGLEMKQLVRCHPGKLYSLG